LIGPIYVSCIVQKILMSTYHQFFKSSFHFHHSIWLAGSVGSGWQVLFDSQHGLIGSEKSDTLQKMVTRQPEPDPQKKKKKLKHTTFSISCSTLSLQDLLCFKLNTYRMHFFLFSLYNARTFLSIFAFNYLHQNLITYRLLIRS
jgi:hypothetical protein